MNYLMEKQDKKKGNIHHLPLLRGNFLRCFYFLHFKHPAAGLQTALHRVDQQA